MSNILRNALLDSSTWVLLASNLIVAYLAVVESWSLVTIMLIYWFQSVIIGFFNFIRILQLKEFSTKGFRIMNKRPVPTQATKTFVAFFFLFHYGFFHVGYLIFITISTLFFWQV